MREKKKRNFEKKKKLKFDINKNNVFKSLEPLGAITSCWNYCNYNISAYKMSVHVLEFSECSNLYHMTAATSQIAAASAIKCS